MLAYPFGHVDTFYDTFFLHPFPPSFLWFAHQDQPPLLMDSMRALFMRCARTESRM